MLHALLTRPHEYQCYIAGSPSIHWNESVLLEEERRLPERLTDELKVRALLTIGELENDGRFHVNVKAEAMAKGCPLSAQARYKPRSVNSRTKITPLSCTS